MPSFVAKRFGLKYSPPTIALEYEEYKDTETDGDKLKLLTIALPHLKPTDGYEKITQHLIRDHPEHLSNTTVDVAQLHRLVKMLVANLPVSDTEDPATGISADKESIHGDSFDVPGGNAKIDSKELVVESTQELDAHKSEQSSTHNADDMYVHAG